MTCCDVPCIHALCVMLSCHVRVCSVVVVFCSCCSVCWWPSWHPPSSKHSTRYNTTTTAAATTTTNTETLHARAQHRARRRGTHTVAPTLLTPTAAHPYSTAQSLAHQISNSLSFSLAPYSIPCRLLQMCVLMSRQPSILSPLLSRSSIPPFPTPHHSPVRSCPVRPVVLLCVRHCACMLLVWWRECGDVERGLAAIIRIVGHVCEQLQWYRYIS